MEVLTGPVGMVAFRIVRGSPCDHHRSRRVGPAHMVAMIEVD